VTRSSDLLNELTINVEDTGIGIREEDQCKLFKLFGSIKNQKKKFNINGIGLGLVICKLIVQKFGGQINFESVYQKGSSF